MTGFSHTATAAPHLRHAATSPRARHGFFGAAGGVSSGVYASLNCGFGSDDDTALVARNRELAGAELGLAPGRMAAVYQVHGREAVIAENMLDQTGAMPGRTALPRADGLVTTTPGLGLTILTADCLPLLLVDDTGAVAGACHAGWRGAAAGIVDATVALMRDQGAGRITALVGPTIQQPSYQVGAEMRSELLDSVAPKVRDLAAACFREDGDRHYRFDLPGLVCHQLAAADVDDIQNCGIDTYPADGVAMSDSVTYFSHRRATHAGDADSGRQIAVIALAG